MIHFVTEDIEMPALDARKVTRWIKAVAAEYGFGVGNINYVFCSDERELEVNRQFLGHDYYTDVITFDYSTASTLNGDIFIPIDAIKYYGGTTVGVAAIFATVDECDGHPVSSVFDPNDLGDYESYKPHLCPICQRGIKIEALVNSFGYSAL